MTPATLAHHRHFGRRFRPGGRLAFLLLIATALATAASARAETPASSGSDAEPRFFIETIAVEGTRRAAPEVIISESLLAAGHSYTETELREGVYRIRRLPFVLDAGFRLGKGTERGRYRLLVRVDEVRSFFFGADLLHSSVGGTLRRSSPLDEDFDGVLLAGARAFAGNGLFFAAVGDVGDFQVGYSRYRLFDRPAFLNVAFARERCCAVRILDLGLDPTASVWADLEDSDRFELTLGIPLGDNHALRLGAARLESGGGHRRQLAPERFGAFLNAGERDQSELELAWIYDTTDDPIFPTRGDRMRSALSVERLDAELAAGAFLEPTIALPALRSRLVALTVAGSRAWPITPRQTVEVRLRLRYGRADVRDLPALADPAARPPLDAVLGTFEGDLGVRYALALRKRHRRGDLVWETEARTFVADTRPTLAPRSLPLRGTSVSTAVALRNAWGLFRFGLIFLDVDGDL